MLLCDAALPNDGCCCDPKAGLGAVEGVPKVPDPVELPNAGRACVPWDAPCVPKAGRAVDPKAALVFEPVDPKRGGVVGCVGFCGCCPNVWVPKADF